jgi:hypothetical protein
MAPQSADALMVSGFTRCLLSLGPDVNVKLRVLPHALYLLPQHRPSLAVLVARCRSQPDGISRLGEDVGGCDVVPDVHGTLVTQPVGDLAGLKPVGISDTPAAGLGLFLPPDQLNRIDIWLYDVLDVSRFVPTRPIVAPSSADLPRTFRAWSPSPVFLIMPIDRPGIASAAPASAASS